MREISASPASHPRWYHQHVSTYWWLWRPAYLKFILRELSSVPVAYVVVLTLLQLRALSRGSASYAAFQEWLKSPIVIALNVVGLLFVLFHTITWFNLAPSAMPVRVRGKRLPDWLIAGPNYVAWLVISAVVAWLIVRG